MTETMGPDRGNGPVLSIVVVSYNTRDLTLACLDSVHAETGATSFELIVVDNASGDGSAEAIRSRFPDARILANAENLGFARAVNLAAAQANGTYLLLLNPDTLVKDRAIERLVSFAESHPEAGIWGGRTLFPDGTLNPKSCWRRMSLWRIFCRSLGLASRFPASPLFNAEAYGGWPRDTVRKVDIVTGCFFLIRRRDWNELGGFDPAFFMYGEEADLCLRARARGFRPTVTPAAAIVHYGGASDRVPARRIHNVLAARALLIRRHISPWSRHLALLLFAIWPFARLLKSRFARTPGAARELGAWREVCRNWHQWLEGRFQE